MSDRRTLALSRSHGAGPGSGGRGVLDPRVSRSFLANLSILCHLAADGRACGTGVPLSARSPAASPMVWLGLAWRAYGGPILLISEGGLIQLFFSPAVPRYQQDDAAQVSLSSDKGSYTRGQRRSTDMG